MFSVHELFEAVDREYDASWCQGST